MKQYNMSEFKIITSLKIQWLKNASEKCGAQHMVIDSKPEDHIVICMISKEFG